MCGIACIINKKGTVNYQRLKEINNILKHRGPNDWGIFLSKDQRIGMSHNRLSLVDLSEKGKQPMTKHNLTIIFNGEIYNFREITKELMSKGYNFFSHSDTETILSAFDCWGIDCVAKFNGPYAFVIYDWNKDLVYIVRDKIGEKPLYYFQNNEQIIIASEIKAIIKNPGVICKPNIDRIIADLIFGHFSDKNDTHFKDIHMLLPGHYIKIDNQDFKTIKYWDIEIDRYTEDSPEKLIQEIYNLLDSATKMRMMADTPVGSILSGGIDSSIITVLASNSSESGLQCFTMDSPTNKELNEDLYYSKLLTSKYQNLNLKLATINESVYDTQNIDRVIYHLEEPPHNKTAFCVNNNYRIAKQNGFKAVINGQGSDEISLGYLFKYPFYQLPETLLSKELFHTYWMERVSNEFDQDLTKSARFIESISRTLENNYFPYYTKGDPVNSLLAFGIKTHLPSLLHQEDKLSMAEGVECRTVFTDFRLVEKFVSIPSQMKILDDREKYLIRKIGEKILPQEIVNRKKQAFPNFPDKFDHELISANTQNLMKNSSILNIIFTKEQLDRINTFSLDSQIKLAFIYKFEKVFF